MRMLKRPSYLNLSPGLDVETRRIAKQIVAEELRYELLAASHRPAIGQPHTTERMPMAAI